MLIYNKSIFDNGRAITAVFAEGKVKKQAGADFKSVETSACI
jgi:hypothetical protein